MTLCDSAVTGVSAPRSVKGVFMKSLATGMSVRSRQWTGLSVLALAFLMSAPALGQEFGEPEATRSVAENDPDKNETDKNEADKASGDAKNMAKDETVTHPIRVTADRVWEALGGGTGELGTTVLGRDSFDVRTNGSGDANSFLRSMPNVQYVNDIDEDPGEDQEDVINLQPKEFSISGGRPYENNIILNGVGINTYSGSVERTEDELTTDDGLPNADLIYGLHSQSIFVPSSMVAHVTVIDSNASAKYGNFQGGVVAYDLLEPPKDRYRAGIEGNYQDDEFVHYKVATDDEQNPLGREHPEFHSHNKAAWVGGPVTDRFRWIGGVSLSEADTRKQRDYKYYSGWVDENSENLFANGAAVLDTQFGEFKLEGSMTDYHQDFESPTHLDLRNDVDTFSYTTQLRHRAKLGALKAGALDLSNIGIETIVFFNDASTENQSNSNELHSYTLKESSGWLSSELGSWCRDNPSDTRITCYRGGYGDRKQAETQTGAKTEIAGEVGAGTFIAGMGVTEVEANRARPEDFTFYSAVETIDDAQPAAFSSFTCPTDDPQCSPEQYADIRTIWSAYDITARMTLADAFAEVSQTWDWFGFRAGVRGDYNDYFDNFDVAPRLTAMVTPFHDLKLEAGYNRYYSMKEVLAMAVRDKQPRGQAYRRSHDSAGNVDATWSQLGSTGNYIASAAGLKTPYVDEYTVALLAEDPFLHGDLRLRYIDRHSKDQYATSHSSSSTKAYLTNDGTGRYRALTLEYAKGWQVDDFYRLSGLGFSGSLTWSDREISTNTYYYSDGADEYIYYNGESYTRATFNKVTGNLDIPVKVNLAMLSRWFDDRFEAGLSADLLMPYQGVRDTGSTISVGGVSHDIYEDHDYGSTLNVDAVARAMIWKWGKNDGLSLELKVTNLLDTAGNRVATDNNPFVRGRAFWVGASATF